MILPAVFSVARQDTLIMPDVLKMIMKKKERRYEPYPAHTALFLHRLISAYNNWSFSKSLPVLAFSQACL